MKRQPAGENWRTLADITADLMERMASQQREKFRKECGRDGVDKQTQEASHAANT